ncbi:hypothetical protein ACFYWO_00990 [Streptomyces sp. NPDC002932]|uniref:NucA/NucB deoxyribonuclease domain-containing protein n=1 Tax=Streptomyces sp. NPDC002932 TaxID=3364672 RepID=UPI00367E70A9
MQSRGRWAAVLAAVSTLFLSLPAQAVADTQSRNASPDFHGRHLGGIGKEALRDNRVRNHTEKAHSIAESCSPTAPGSTERRVGAVSACTATAITSTQTAKTTAAAARADTQEDAGLCSITDPGKWHFERLSACLREMTVNFTLRDEKQQVLGSAVFYVSSNTTLNPRSGLWNEDLTVEATHFQKAVTSVSMTFEVGCTANCKATQKNPWVGIKTLTDGQVAVGRVAYSDVPAVGLADATTINYHLNIATSGTPLTQPDVSWSNPRSIRCDSALTESGNTSTGCALPSITPELSLPLQTYGAAAATYEWAQYHLPDKWGLYSGKPLTRALDGPVRRRKTCEDQSSVPFVRKPSDQVPNDSCDEFPFASTWQGGTDGGLCAEIVMLLEDGEWQAYEADPARPVTMKEHCVRGHVPLDVNQLAGTAYSNLIQGQRLIDKDPFHVSTS